MKEIGKCSLCGKKGPIWTSTHKSGIICSKCYSDLV